MHFAARKLRGNCKKRLRKTRIKGGEHEKLELNWLEKYLLALLYCIFFNSQCTLNCNGPYEYNAHSKLRVYVLHSLGICAFYRKCFSRDSYKAYGALSVEIAAPT